MTKQHGNNTVPSDPSDDDRTVHEEVHAPAPHDMADYQGERIERIITTKDFLPAGDPQFAQRLGCEPRGTRVILGTLRGVVHSTERKTKLWNERELESVWLNGTFEAIMKGTGEIKTSPTAILPKAFGITIENALRSREEGEELSIDCDIGLEATGRSIPYEWIVIYYRDGKAHKALRSVRARSEARLAHAERMLAHAERQASLPAPSEH